jgi:hypothetical protein
MSRIIFLLASVAVLAAMAFAGTSGASTTGSLTVPDSTVVYSGAAASADVVLTAVTTQNSQLACSGSDGSSSFVSGSAYVGTWPAGTLTNTFTDNLAAGTTTTFSCDDDFAAVASWTVQVVAGADPAAITGACSSNFALSPANGAKADRNADGQVCTDNSTNGKGKAVVDNSH